MSGGVNVNVGEFVIVDVEVCEGICVGVGVSVIVGVKVFVGVKVCEGVDVCEGLAVTVGIEAIKVDAAALTDETNWAAININASRMPTALRESKDLLI